jgi:opacity protein-like surface antigen
MKTRLPLALAALAIAAASPASAQDDEYERPVQQPTGWYAGGDFTFAHPEGEFHDFVRQGFGGGAHVIRKLDRAGIVGLRLDGGFVVYGSEHQRVALSPTVGGRIQVDLNTTNNIAFVGVGPQVGLPNGLLRPYVNGFAGVSYLFTESSLQGTSSGETFASTTNYHDATFSWGGGAGVYVPVRRGASPISIDAGLRYHNNGQARYLREGDIHDNPDNTITVTPVRSDTDLLTFHLGVSVGISH